MFLYVFLCACAWVRAWVCVCVREVSLLPEKLAVLLILRKEHISRERERERKRNFIFVLEKSGKSGKSG